MPNTDYKSVDDLLKHLQKDGIAISGTSQKQQLINTGYFHGYKGYRVKYHHVRNRFQQYL